MFRNNLILPGTFLLALVLLGLPPPAFARDLSTVQTALRIAQDEMDAAKTQRDADAQRLAVTEKEMERLKQQLEAERKKSKQSEQRYQESLKQYDKAKAAFSRAMKH